jgi:hypothetical protein
VEEVIVNTQTEEITVRHILPLDQKFPLCKGSNRAELSEHHSHRAEISLRLFVDDIAIQ